MHEIFYLRIGRAGISSRVYDARDHARENISCISLFQILWLEGAEIVHEMLSEMRTEMRTEMRLFL